MSNAETNKALFRRFIECMDKQDFASVRAMFAPEFRAHPSGQTMPAGGYEQMCRMFYTAFPDGKQMTRPPELDALEIFSGTIQGKGRAAAGPFGPEQTFGTSTSAKGGSN